MYRAPAREIVVVNDAAADGTLTLGVFNGLALEALRLTLPEHASTATVEACMFA